MNLIKSTKIKRKVKRTFLKKGTCSRTFFYILNQEFGYPMDAEEQAADPLAGGILQQGYQCGMLWGASLAVGAESYRRCENLDQAIALSISATQHVMKSFIGRTKTADCGDITNTDFSSKVSMAKYLFSGKFYSCFKLAEKWAPEAINSAREGLNIDYAQLPKNTLSCAAEVARKMGASDEELVMVAGFAGGLGMSGNACGALAAAIWKTALDSIREGSYKPSYTDPVSEKILNKFYKVSDYKMECKHICDQKFKSIEDHSNFIENGGCNKIINSLAESHIQLKKD